MTIRRTAPIVDNAAVRRAVLVARARAAFDAAHDAEASRTVRTVGADGAVVIATRDAPPPPPSEAELVAERIRARRLQLALEAQAAGRTTGWVRPVGS